MIGGTRSLEVHTFFIYSNPEATSTGQSWGGRLAGGVCSNPKAYHRLVLLVADDQLKRYRDHLSPENAASVACAQHLLGVAPGVRIADCNIIAGNCLGVKCNPMMRDLPVCTIEG